MKNTALDKWLVMALNSSENPITISEARDDMSKIIVSLESVYKPMLGQVGTNTL